MQQGKPLLQFKLKNSQTIIETRLSFEHLQVVVPVLRLSASGQKNPGTRQRTPRRFGSGQTSGWGFLEPTAVLPPHLFSKGKQSRCQISGTLNRYLSPPFYPTINTSFDYLHYTLSVERQFFLSIPAASGVLQLLSTHPTAVTERKALSVPHLQEQKQALHPLTSPFPAANQAKERTNRMTEVPVTARWELPPWRSCGRQPCSFMTSCWTTYITISLFVLLQVRGKQQLNFLVLTELYKEQHRPFPHFLQLYHKLISRKLL